MSVIEHKEFNGHEQVVYFNDEKTGLKAIIAIHNTNLGPALGGCRVWDYAHEDEALEDVLRLSRGMTYKAAISGLPLGGGKSVIIGDSKKIKTPELMQAMGRSVERLAGRYIIAEDVGTCVEDMLEIRKETKNVVGLPAIGDGKAGGDPSPLTALGTFEGIKAAVKHRLGKDSLNGIKVSVQGVGHVGAYLCRMLSEAGAELFITDINQEQLEQIKSETGATIVGLDEIYDLDVDVFAPCALGAIINDDTLDRLKVTIVAGSSNNQLKEDRHGQILKDRNVLYAPDYVINAGGLINVYYEQQAKISGKNGGTGEARVHIMSIADTLNEIFALSDKENIPTNVAADRIAEKRLQNINNVVDIDRKAC